MKKYLIVSGCSYTTNNFRSIFHPKLKCDWPKWPELLGKKLGMNVINLAYSGSGNERIFSSLIDKMSQIDHSEIGLVISAWSSCLRKDWRIQDRWFNILFDDKGDLEYHINKSLRFYYMLQVYCEKNNIPYKQVQAIEFISKRLEPDRISILHRDTYQDENGPEIIKKSIYYDKINKENFLGYPMLTELDGFNIQGKLTKDKEIEKVFKISSQDSHPSKVGHEMIASFLYENF